MARTLSKDIVAYKFRYSHTHVDSMDSRFRKVFLQNIEDIMNQEPSRDTLVKLLQMVKPDFSEDDSLNEPARGSAFRALKGLIHPDKNPDCAQTITSLFQEVQSFYDKCCIVIISQGSNNSNGIRRRSPTSVNYPLQFHIKDKWSYLEVVEPKMPLFIDDPGLLARLVAYKCINFRGAIAHGKNPELYYSSEQVTGFMEWTTVKDAFDDAGGSKVLSDIDAIKEELMNRGPVVSTSFVLSEAFVNAACGEHFISFATSQINQTHPLVIVGWILTAYGEMWLVRAMDGSSPDIPIAFGQFSIDDECLAPLDNFEQTPWQDNTKAVDVFMGDVDWYSWTGIVTYVDNAGLTAIAKAMGGSLFGKNKIVLRDKDKIARSRWANVTDVSLSDDGKKWKVTASFAV